MITLGKKANPGKLGDAKSWVYNHLNSIVIRIARPPKIAKPPKDGDAKPGVYTQEYWSRSTG